MKRSLSIGLVVVAALVGAAVFGQQWFVSRQRDPGAASLGEAAAMEGVTSVRATGTVLPRRWQRMSFLMGGELRVVTATVGSTVVSGQPLASLETRDLELELQLAQSELNSAQSQLDHVRKGPSAAERAAAVAAYEAAQAAYQALMEVPSAQEVALAQAELALAERALQQAQAAYDAVRNLPDIGARREALALEEASIAYQRAKAAFALATAGPDAAALKQAESRVAEARANLESVDGDMQQLELRSAEARLAAAWASAERASLALARAVLRAPYTSTVTSIADVRPGEVVAGGETVLTIAELEQLQVEVADLDDWGAAMVTPNQLVNMLVPALNNRRLTGRLTFLAPEPTTSANGGSFYRAVVTLDRQEPDLRWGMSVRVEFDIPGAQRRRS